MENVWALFYMWRVPVHVYRLRARHREHAGCRHMHRHMPHLKHSLSTHYQDSPCLRAGRTACNHTMKAACLLTRRPNPALLLSTKQETSAVAGIQF